MITITNTSIESNFDASPDQSINFETVKKHYEKFPERWNTVFKFLEETDLKTAENGRIDLSDDVFAAINEYESKNLEDAFFESHKKYIDLQYVISGNELIGLSHKLDMDVKTPYSEEKDLCFYNYKGGTLLPASPANYFIFFPEDIHQPGIINKKKKTIKKVVLKIRVDD